MLLTTCPWPLLSYFHCVKQATSSYAELPLDHKPYTEIGSWHILVPETVMERGKKVCEVCFPMEEFNITKYTRVIL